MAGIEDGQLDVIQKQMQDLQRKQDDQLLNLRKNYQETIHKVMNEAQQGISVHRETLERKYLAAYEAMERQLRSEFTGTLKQVERELELLRQETNQQKREAEHRLAVNTELVETFQAEQKEQLERAKNESQKEKCDAENACREISQNCFAKVLYSDILYEYQRTCRHLNSYLEKEFYQTVIAVSHNLLSDCKMKQHEIKRYMERYAGRLLTLQKKTEQYQSLLYDNYRKAELYGEAVCRKHEVDEGFIDFWSNGMFAFRTERLEQSIVFLKEHGMEIGENYDVATVIDRIKAALAADSVLEKKEHLIEYINMGDILVYDKEKMIQDEMVALRNENNEYRTTITLYNERLKYEELIDAKLLQYQYQRVEDSTADGLDERIGVSLHYENEEGYPMEICIISVKNNLKKSVENQIAIAVDYGKLGMIAEQYIIDRKAILREIPLLRNCVMEVCGDIHTCADTKYAVMQRTLYDKCNPYGRS